MFLRGFFPCVPIWHAVLDHLVGQNDAGSPTHGNHIPLRLV